MRRSTAGLTIVELLIAASLLVVMLGMVGVYFARTASLTRDTQARSQVQDTARSVMQLVTNDILSAGANQYVPAGTASVTPIILTGAIPTGTDGGLLDAVDLQYVSSLRPTLATACRQVEYQVSGSTLERSDVPCSGTANLSTLADHVLAFDLVYVCSDTNSAATPSDCPSNTYVRSVRVGLMVRSDHTVQGSGPSPTYTAPTPTYPTGTGGQSVTCPATYVCAVLEQTVQTPSLKQYAPGG